MSVAKHSDRNFDNVEDVLKRFSYPTRDKIYACANMSPRVAQLAQTHPVLFAFLAGKSGRARERRYAVRSAIEGQPLAEICSTVGLPIAFREIPPEAVVRRLAAVSWTKNASRELRSLVPEDADTACRWLYAVTNAHRLGGEPFALWLAQQRDLLRLNRFSNQWLLPLAAFAWQSGHSGHALSPPDQQKWTARLSLLTSIDRARGWLVLLRGIMAMGKEGLSDTWLEGGNQNGFTISPIRTGRELFCESLAMRNCVHSYAGCLARGQCRLFSVKHDGTPVATFEVRACPDANKFLVSEIKGPLNRSTSLHVVVAVHQWLDRQSHRFPPRDWEFARVAELEAGDEPCDLFAEYCASAGIPKGSAKGRLTVHGFEISLQRFRAEVIATRARSITRSHTHRLCHRASRT